MPVGGLQYLALPAQLAQPHIGVAQRAQAGFQAGQLRGDLVALPVERFLLDAQRGDAAVQPFHGGVADLAVGGEARPPGLGHRGAGGGDLAVDLAHDRMVARILLDQVGALDLQPQQLVAALVIGRLVRGLARREHRAGRDRHQRAGGAQLAGRGGATLGQLAFPPS